MSTDPNGNLRVAVVMPVHNEAAHVAGAVASVPSWVAGIIVVDDASTDETASVVEGLGDPRVTLVRHETNKGVGGAMRTGYRHALEMDFDLVGKMDGDGQMVGAELARLCVPFRLDLADYAKGNRFYLAGATAHMPMARSFGNNALSFLTKLASGYWHVFDSQCGYTMIRVSYLRRINLDDLPDDYFFENAMLIALNALNARVVDVPTSTLYGAEVSGVSIRRVIMSFPPRLLAGGTKRFWRKNLVTDFGAISVLTVSGLALSAFGFIFGLYHWYLSIVTDHVASTGTVMIAVLPLIVGVQALLQALSLSVSASPGAAETAAYVRELLAQDALD